MTFVTYTPIIKLHKVNNRHALSADCVGVNPVVHVAPFDLFVFLLSKLKSSQSSLWMHPYGDPRKPYVILKTVMDSRHLKKAPTARGRCKKGSCRKRHQGFSTTNE